ncbi:DUF427 domain-containing protein [Nocardioides sp. TF02-7]|uniref:DUF427 domain-containing protein n=1 Tax=Nocardioides sp. TF02-7 TaxID=2917724 RepID=UPI001F053008|nr:DUF427 domain-containing protein [Nocardioides sp. TF02-7]UMG93744.1 DUF427 domain-containing protein [Nocardioides sp. TF02-7]
MKRHLGQSISELRFEPVAVRLRAYVDGRPALDTVRAALVWEPRRLVPVYAVPEDDLLLAVEPTEPPPAAPDLAAYPPMLGPDSFEPHTTPGTVVDLVGPDRRLDRAGFRPDDPVLDGLVVLDFAAFDRWLAEDEELVGHPHDPFKRIDVLSSRRHVEISLDGTVLAATDRPLLLIETHLPVRYYVPPADVATSLLRPSDTRSTCAYKGHATYLSTADGSAAGRDIGWTYRQPLDDALRVRDHVAFWNERTDVRVDGELLRRPVTPWSTPAEQRGADADSLEFG